MGAAAVAAAGSARADIVDTLTINTLLQNGGGSLSGQFNVGSQLMAAPGPQVVTGGSVIVYGISSAAFQNSSSTQYQTINSYSYQTGGGYWVQTGSYYSFWGGYYAYGYYVPPQYATHTDVNVTTTNTKVDNQVDTLGVTIGAQTSSASDLYHAATSSGLQYNGSTNTGSYYGGNTTYYNYTQTIESGYYGPLSATLNLQQGDIDALNQTGLLSFLFFASNGQLNVQSATLNLSTIDAPTQIAGVPELPTWLMMLAGFGALGVAANRRRQRNKTTTVTV